jgi:hypothetical protein
MFFLIGGDGREYGPFSAEQIREWLAQGRANAHSRIRRDGEATWQSLQERRVCCRGERLAAARRRAAAALAGVDRRRLRARAVPIDISSCLSRGWALVRADPGLTIGATLLIMLVSFGLSMLPVINLLAFFINPVLLGGLAYVFSRRIRGENPGLGDAFNGFNLAFLQLGLGGLVSFLLICVGLVLCVLPGIYLAVGYTFALPLIIDKKYDFWSAMEVSRRVVHRQWWTLFGLAMVLFLLNIVGVLACLVGCIVTAPLSVAAIMYAYEDLFGARQAIVPHSL